MSMVIIVIIWFYMPTLEYEDTEVDMVYEE